MPLDKPAAEKVIRRYRRQWFAKRKSIAAIVKEVMTNEQSVLVDTDADNKAADADAALQELGADLVSYGYVTTTFIVMRRGRSAAPTRSSVPPSASSTGAASPPSRKAPMRSRPGSSSLPGHVYANVRAAPVNTLNLAHMMPLSASWAGPERNDHLDGPPLLTVRTNGATPFRLVTHVGDVGHTIVVGPTGAGKSVLLSLIALQFRRYANAQVTIFDKGGSARAAVLGMGGSYFDLGAAQEGVKNALAFQPLANIDLPSERTFAQEWVLGLLAHEGVEVTPETKDAVWSALSNLAAAPQPERTLTGLATLLQRNDLRQALQPYTLEGPYGRLLDADEDRLSLGAVQCFEMEELMHSQGAVLPVLTYLFHRLEQTLRRQAGASDPRRGLAVPRQSGLCRPHPRMAEDAPQAQRLGDLRDARPVRHRQFLDRAGDHRELPEPHLPAQRPGDRAAGEGHLRSLRAQRPADRDHRAGRRRSATITTSRGRATACSNSIPVRSRSPSSRRPSKHDHALMDELIAAHGEDEFADSWLRARGLDWAAELIGQQPSHQPPQGDLP